MAISGYAQPAKKNDHSANYSKCFAAGQGSPVDLTNVFAQCRCATSGLYALATAATIQLTYKDAGGNTVDSGSLGTIPLGTIIRLPVAATELTTNTGLVVWAYWHSSNLR